VASVMVFINHTSQQSKMFLTRKATPSSWLRHVTAEILNHTATVFQSENPFIRRVRKIAIRDYWLCHVCLSVGLHGTTRLPLDRFSLNLIFDFF
jgi:hypothetical protein